MKDKIILRSAKYFYKLVFLCMSHHCVLANANTLVITAYPPTATSGVFQVPPSTWGGAGTMHSLSLIDGIFSFEDTDTSFTNGISHYAYQEKLELVGVENIPTIENCDMFGNLSPDWYSQILVTGLVYRSPKLEVKEYLAFPVCDRVYQIVFRVKNLQSQQEQSFLACGPQDRINEVGQCVPPSWPPSKTSPISKK